MVGRLLYIYILRYVHFIRSLLKGVCVFVFVLCCQAMKPKAFCAIYIRFGIWLVTPPRIYMYVSVILQLGVFVKRFVRFCIVCFVYHVVVVSVFCVYYNTYNYLCSYYFVGVDGRRE